MPGRAELTENQRIDAQHLQAIQQAIFRYIEDQGTPPPHLSTLFPDYLQDQGLLLSPADNAAHDQGHGGFPDPKRPCSYRYELRHDAAAPAPSAMMEQYALMQSYGDVVPLLRCHCYGSEQTLSLSYGGVLYISPAAWEKSPAVEALLAKAGRTPADGGGRATLRCENEEKQPVEEVKVIITSRVFIGLPLPDLIVLTDEKGEAKIPLGPDGKSPCHLEFEKAGHLADEREWEGLDTGPSRETIVIPMKAAQHVGGLVTDSAGQPLAGARLILYGQIQEDKTWLERNLGETRTTADGHWKFTSLAPTARGLSLSVQAEHCFKKDLYSQTQGATALDVNALRASQLVIALAPALTVRIISPEPTRKSRTWAAFSPDGEVSDSHSLQQLPSQLLEQEPHYLISEPGDFWLLACPEGAAPSLRKTRLVGQDVSLEIPLQRGRKISGKVLNDHQQPVAHTTIYLQQMGPVIPTERCAIAETDAAGEFTWEQAPAFPVIIGVSKTTARLQATHDTIILQAKD